MNERSIQDRLAMWLIRQKQHRICVPNFHLLFGEADLLSLTKANLAYEFEIKLTKSDFRADFKKERKHKAMADRERRADWIASRFWYVTPLDLIDISELPEYAGLLQIGEDKIVRTTKEAPRPT